MVKPTDTSDIERTKRIQVAKLHRGEPVAMIATIRPDVWRDPPARIAGIGPLGIYWAPFHE